MAETASSSARYLWTFVALLALTAVTTAVAYVDLGALNTAAALAIASAKAAFGVVVFMHVRASGHMGGVLAGVGLFWLVVLVGLTVADSAARAAG
jgi:cytochrome c oxidase subunit 4